MCQLGVSVALPLERYRTLLLLYIVTVNIKEVRILTMGQRRCGGSWVTFNECQSISDSILHNSTMIVPNELHFGPLGGSASFQA